MLSEAMERFIKEHEKEAYDLLLTIAKIPSPSNHEEKRAQFCCNWLKEQGAEGVYIDAVSYTHLDVYKRQEVPGASPKDCGNYLDMNLGMAKYLAVKYLKVLTHID